jgi:hypothetical protein
MHLSLTHSNIFLHPTQQQVAWSLSLVKLRCHECVELLVMPLPSSDISASAIREHSLVFSPEEVGDGVAVLVAVQRDDSVDARLHCVAARKAERVPNVDDCGADFGCDESEFFGS